MPFDVSSSARYGASDPGPNVVSKLVFSSMMIATCGGVLAATVVVGASVVGAAGVGGAVVGAVVVGAAAVVASAASVVADELDESLDEHPAATTAHAVATITIR